MAKKTTTKTKVKETTPKKESKKVLSFVASSGALVPFGNYTYTAHGAEAVEPAPHVIKKMGTPVEEDDLLDTFHKVFAAKHEFLFYKEGRKEVYTVIVPLTHVTELGAEEDSVTGECQVHAMSFIMEGSIDADTLTSKLKRIAKNLNYTK